MGGDYYIAIPPPYLPRGGKWLYNHFSGSRIYYIAIFPPIKLRVSIAMGGNGSITPALKKPKQHNTARILRLIGSLQK